MIMIQSLKKKKNVIITFLIIKLYLISEKRLGLFKTQLLVKFFNSFFYKKDFLERSLKNNKVIYKPCSFVKQLSSSGYVKYLDFNKTQLMNSAKKILNENKKKKINQSNKEFMSNILDLKDQKKDTQNILKYAVDPVLLNTLIIYFGYIPKLASIKLLLSKPSNDNVFKSSQLFHLDHADLPNNHCKLFINISDVKLNNGPFLYLSDNSSKSLIKKTNYGQVNSPYRVRDSQVNQIDKKSLVGKSGSSILIDTSRCFHAGSRVRRGYRCVLMYQYTSGIHSRLQKIDKWDINFEINNLQKKVLGI